MATPRPAAIACGPTSGGNDNTATGAASLNLNTAGYSNTATGSNSLAYNTVGYNNTATGSNSLAYNTGGADNTANGASALYSNDVGIKNTASGWESLYANTGGYENTANGFQSLRSNGMGYYNTASGSNAGAAYATGNDDTFLGAYSDAAVDGLWNATAIGFGAIVDASYHVRIGNTIVTQIGGQVAWSNLSDARHKQDIRDLSLGLDFVLALRPVAFTLKTGDGRTDMGFLAQDVEALLGDGYSVLGIGGDADRTLSLRYTDFIAPMVKAIQEQQAQITDQAKTIQAQQAQLEALKTALAERDSALERRLAALERRKP